MWTHLGHLLNLQPSGGTRGSNRWQGRLFLQPCKIRSSCSTTQQSTLRGWGTREGSPAKPCFRLATGRSRCAAAGAAERPHRGGRDGGRLTHSLATGARDSGSWCLARPPTHARGCLQASLTEHLASWYRRPRSCKQGPGIFWGVDGRARLAARWRMRCWWGESARRRSRSSAGGRRVWGSAGEENGDWGVGNGGVEWFSFSFDCLAW
jgi:hypothetical protein